MEPEDTPILRQFQAEPAVCPHFLQTSRYDQLGGMINRRRTRGCSLHWLHPPGNTNKWKKGHLHSAQGASSPEGLLLSEQNSLIKLRPHTLQLGIINTQFLFLLFFVGSVNHIVLDYSRSPRPSIHSTRRFVADSELAGGRHEDTCC